MHCAYSSYKYIYPHVHEHIQFYLCIHNDNVYCFLCLFQFSSPDDSSIYIINTLGTYRCASVCCVRLARYSNAYRGHIYQFLTMFLSKHWHGNECDRIHTPLTVCTPGRLLGVATTRYLQRCAQLAATKGWLQLAFFFIIIEINKRGVSIVVEVCAIPVNKRFPFPHVWGAQSVINSLAYVIVCHRIVRVEYNKFAA